MPALSLKNPIWLIILVAIGIAVAIGLVGGTLGFFAGGGAVRVITGVVAAAYFIALAVLLRYLSITLTRSESINAIRANPVALSIISGSVLLAAALVTAAVFG